MATPDHIQALLNPDCYPERPRRIFFRDTHASRLYFTPRFVYKIKKPVDFGFLDFTTLERRRFFCEEEVRLNAPSAPDTYLGVVPVRVVDGRIRVAAAEGEILDYLVKMRRLSQARMLDRLIRRGAPGLEDQMDRLAPQLLALFQRSREVEDSSPSRLCAQIRFNCEENLAQTRDLGEELLAPAAWRCAADYTAWACSDAGLATLLLERAERGLVREGHGDLHCEHIWLGKPIRIYDCIEFNRRLRINDALSELAFLLMDLDMRGRPDLARRLRHRCLDARPDLEAPSLLRFYLLYRAWVRGKVAALTCRDRHVDEAVRREAAVSARRYFALALGALAPPFLAITCGPMGSGKSTLADALARATRAELLRSDVLRKELAGLPAAHRAPLPFNAGLYDATHSARTYAALLSGAEAALVSGKSVVVDAAFSRRDQRSRFRQLAREQRVPFLPVYLEAPEALTRARLAARDAAGTDPSDGRVALYREHLANFEFPEDHEMIEKIDSTGDVDYNVQLRLARYLSDHGWLP